MLGLRWKRGLAWAGLICAGLQGIARAAEQVEPEAAVQMPLASRAVFLDIARAGERVVAAGERGIVIYSDDDGASWTQAKVPVRGTLTSLTFLDERNGFAVGHDAAILRTADSGGTWEVVQFAPESQNLYLKVRFRSAQWGYVVGTNGQILTTQNGGSSWQAQTLSVEDWYQNHLFDVVWSATTTLVAAEKGVLYQSADGLRAWTPVESPYEGSYFGAETVGDGRFLLYGMSGRAYLGVPGAWTRLDTATEQFLYDATALPDGRALVVGAGGTYVIVDATAGSALTRQRGNRVGFTAVVVHGERVFLAAASGGILEVPLGELLSD